MSSPATKFHISAGGLRVRFAPSPTGFLHVGGARTALFNYFLARSTGGKFVLRIEDTDTERNRPEFEQEILSSMKWLGMDWDEGPFYQTRRFDEYRGFAKKLIERGRAYRCYCTPAEVEAMRKLAEAEGRKPMYDRRCRHLKVAPAGRTSCVRFAAPLEGEVVIDDLIKGEVRVNLSEIDDFVILRTNDTPTYNFTVVVDDVDMRITHVVRAEEHLNNAPKQALMIEALGFERPQYAHVPLVLAPDRTKLSKRHGAVGVTQYRRDGYLKEALVNYLAKLGWGEKASDRELYTMADLGQLFSLESCHASGAVFDVAKLNWFNAHYIKLKSPAELVALIQDHLQVDFSWVLRNPAGEKLFLALRERAVTLKDFVSGAAWLEEKPLAFDAAAVDGVLKTRKSGAVEALVTQLQALPAGDFVVEKIAPAIKAAVAAAGVKMPEIGKPARVLLTGGLTGPDLALILECLGPQRAIARLQAAV